MEKLSIVDLKEICGRAWDVPACEVALLLNPQSTEVVHTRGTSVRLLVSQRHDVLCGPNAARLIVEGALKELEESVPLRRGAAEDLRRQLAAQQHRVAEVVMHREYDPASARLTLNGREVATHPTDATPRGTEMLRARHTGTATLRGVVDEFTYDEAMRRIGLAMLNAPRRVVTAEDVARIERAKAKRARKAAARRVS